MKITYTDAKEFVLTSNEEIFLGSLKMEKWSSTKAQITTQYGDFYDIEKKGFWGTSIVVLKSSEEFAELKINWKGQVVIDMLANGKGMDYMLKSTSIWKSQFTLFSREETELLIFTIDYRWKKGHYNLKIDVNPNFANEIDETLVLVATYSVLYLLMVQNAAMVAAVA